VFRTWGATVAAVAVLAGAEPQRRSRRGRGSASLSVLRRFCWATRPPSPGLRISILPGSTLAALTWSPPPLPSPPIALARVPWQGFLPIQGSRQRSFLESPMRPPKLSLETRSECLDHEAFRGHLVWSDHRTEGSIQHAPIKCVCRREALVMLRYLSTATRGSLNRADARPSRVMNCKSRSRAALGRRG